MNSNNTTDAAADPSKQPGIEGEASLTRFEECLPIFERFVDFFQNLFMNPNPLEHATCRQSHKDFVPRYYEKLFGPKVDGMNARHFKWLHRFKSICELPRGSRIVDVGGGYGLDSILLSLFGYQVVFFEISPHHIAVCKEFKRLWELEGNPLFIEMVEGLPMCGREDHLAFDAEAIGRVAAVLYNEVAHHVEPATGVFELSARVLDEGGRLFLLEPNFWNPLIQAYFFKNRGFKTVKQIVNEETGLVYDSGDENIRPSFRWCTLAEPSGFRLRNAEYVVPYFVKSFDGLHAGWRRWLENTPGIRSVAATHITYEFELGSS